MFRQPPKFTNDVVAANTQFIQPDPPVLPEADSEKSSDMLTHNKNFLSSNILLKRILEKHNDTHMPTGLSSRNFYSNLDLMTIKWAASLNRRMSRLFLKYQLNLFFFRRQSCCFFCCFLSNNSHFSTYMWHFNCTFNILFLSIIFICYIVEQTIIYSSILFNKSI